MGDLTITVEAPPHGYCPVQAWGMIGPYRWYYRARGRSELEIGIPSEDPKDVIPAEALDFVEVETGLPGYSGWWEGEDVEPYLMAALREWGRGKVVEVTDG